MELTKKGEEASKGEEIVRNLNVKLTDATDHVTKANDRIAVLNQENSSLRGKVEVAEQEKKTANRWRGTRHV
ncbi:hypothetical protein V494_06054 [Pseudogymnoascus sp. VKM F-4513 (FW-928)]|nr:hypothetical protein V494_06054 [Pseudogymnoascus sp. VKM F-4513 (FW-928)]